MTVFLGIILAALIGVVLGILDKDKRRYYYFSAICICLGLLLVVWGVSIRIESTDNLTTTSIVPTRFEFNSTDRILLLDSVEGSFKMYDVNLPLTPSSTFDSSKGVEALLWKHPRNDGEIIGLRANQLEVSPEIWIRSNNGTAKQAIVGGLIFCFLGILIGAINYSQRRSGTDGPY